MPFQRKLTLFDATMLVIGNVVGAGIFTTAGFLASELNNPWQFAGIWVIGGLLTLCGALTYAELAGMFPRSGGDYHYLKAAYGSWAGFLLGWVCLLIINPGSIAVLSLAMVRYLSTLMGFSGAGEEKILAVSIIAGFTWVNFRGVRLTGTFQNLWVLGSLAMLLFFMVAGVASGRGDWGHFSATTGSSVELSRLLGPAMIAVIFSYSGWFVSSYIGDEVIRPERNLPLSLTVGTGVVVLLYVVLNSVYLYAVPLEGLKGVVNVGHLAGERLLGQGAARVISLAIILAVAASINATVLSGARLTYALARDGLFWAGLENVHPTHGTPARALSLQAAVACLYVVVDSFEALLGSVVLVMLLSSIASACALLLLRRRGPHEERTYRTPGYPLTPAVFIISYCCIAVQIFLSSPVRSLAGIAITASGVPVYLWMTRGRKNRLDSPEALSETASLETAGPLGIRSD